MKTMKRVFTILLAIAMLAALFAGCGAPAEEPAPAETEAPAETQAAAAATEAAPADPFHITDEPISVTVAAGWPTVWGDPNNMTFFKMIEEKTGVHFDWNTFPLEVAAERVGIMMSGSDMPDVFYTHNNMTLAQCNLYGTQGLLVDLKPLIKEHAPHIAQVFDELDAWKAYDAGNGCVYTIPMTSLATPDANTVYTEVMINRELLEKVGMEMPTTTEEFYEVLKAFKGQKTADGKDIIPFSYGPVYNYGDMIRGAFGFVDSTGGPSLMDGVYLMYDGEKIDSIADKDNYKAFLKYMSKLYTEGLIDQEIYTHDNNMFIAKGMDGRYGALVDWAGPWVVGANRIDESDGINSGEYVGMPVLAGPDGIKLTQNRYGGLRNACDFCISTACEDPVTLIKLCDLFYNEELELGLQHSMGVKDETRHVRDDGMIEYIPEALEKFGGDLNALRASSTEPFGPYYISAETSAKLVPGANAIYKGQIDNELGYNEAAKYPVIPNLSFTEEETEELAILRTDLVEYIKSFEAACITGQKDVDAEWEKHLEKLETLEQTRLVEIYSASLDRYNGVQ